MRRGSSVSSVGGGIAACRGSSVGAELWDSFEIGTENLLLEVTVTDLDGAGMVFSSGTRCSVCRSWRCKVNWPWRIM